jgi:hypothetical protein
MRRLLRMPDGEKGDFMASQLSLGTHIRCQSLRLRALEMIDNLHGQAGGQSCPKGTDVCGSYFDIRQKIVCLIRSNK